MAKAMVDAGAAAIHNSNGKVKSVALLPTAHLIRIGEPTVGWLATPPFSVRERLDCGGIVWKHHRRCFDE